MKENCKYNCVKLSTLITVHNITALTARHLLPRLVVEITLFYRFMAQSVSRKELRRALKTSSHLIFLLHGKRWRSYTTLAKLEQLV